MTTDAEQKTYENEVANSTENKHGGKKIAKTIVKRDRGLQWAPYRQYNKKGRKII